MSRMPTLLFSWHCITVSIAGLIEKGRLQAGKGMDAMTARLKEDHAGASCNTILPALTSTRFNPTRSKCGRARFHDFADGPAFERLPQGEWRHSGCSFN